MMGLVMHGLPISGDIVTVDVCIDVVKYYKINDVHAYIRLCLVLFPDDNSMTFGAMYPQSEPSDANSPSY